MNRERLDRLDGLRGLAACGIAFLYHPIVEASAEAVEHAPAIVLWLRHWGWTFVDLFFLISGYIFAHVYVQGRGLRQADLPGFALARFARLYPLHLLTLLVCAVLFAATPANTWYAFIAHLFMMQAFVVPVGHTFDGPSWSLSVEVFCYAVFAVAAVRGDKALYRVSVAVVVASLGYLLLLGGPGGGPWAGDSLPRGFLGFFLGQILWRHRDRLARVPSVILVALLVIGLSIDMGSSLSPLPPLCLLAWPAALLLALRVPAMGSRAMLWLGERSYSIYLVHYPVLLCFLPRLHATQDMTASVTLMPAYLPLVLALSELTYRCVEVPARRGVRALWQRRRAATGQGVLTA